MPDITVPTEETRKEWKTTGYFVAPPGRKLGVRTMTIEEKNAFDLENIVATFPYHMLLHAVDQKQYYVYMIREPYIMDRPEENYVDIYRCVRIDKLIAEIPDMLNYKSAVRVYAIYENNHAIGRNIINYAFEHYEERVMRNILYDLIARGEFAVFETLIIHGLFANEKSARNFHSLLIDSFPPRLPKILQLSITNKTKPFLFADIMENLHVFSNKEMSDGFSRDMWNALFNDPEHRRYTADTRSDLYVHLIANNRIKTVRAVIKDMPLTAGDIHAMVSYVFEQGLSRVEFINVLKKAGGDFSMCSDILNKDLSRYFKLTEPQKKLYKFLVAIIGMPDEAKRNVTYNMFNNATPEEILAAYQEGYVDPNLCDLKTIFLRGKFSLEDLRDKFGMYVFGMIKTKTTGMYADQYVDLGQRMWRVNNYSQLDQHEKHYDHVYSTGLNIDAIPFNPSGSCEAGGLYFAPADYHAGSISVDSSWGERKRTREVLIPLDARVYEDRGGSKYKADKIIVLPALDDPDGSVSYEVLAGCILDDMKRGIKPDLNGVNTSRMIATFGKDAFRTIFAFYMDMYNRTPQNVHSAWSIMLREDDVFINLSPRTIISVINQYYADFEHTDELRPMLERVIAGGTLVRSKMLVEYAARKYEELYRDNPDDNNIKHLPMFLVKCLRETQLTSIDGKYIVWLYELCKKFGYDDVTLNECFMVDALLIQVIEVDIADYFAFFIRTTEDADRFESNRMASHYWNMMVKSDSTFTFLYLCSLWSLPKLIEKEQYLLHNTRFSLTFIRIIRRMIKVRKEQHV